jgi:Reverse transcriptase (RNA-dependent DNA polymerase)
LGPVPTSIDSLPTATIQSILPNHPSSHQSQQQLSPSTLIIPSHESQHALPSSPHPISSSESPRIALSSPPQDLSIPSSSPRPHQPNSLHSSPSDPFLSLSQTQPPAGQSSPLTHLSPSAPTKHSMTTRTQDNTYKKRIFSNFVAHQINLESEPSSFKQAMSSPNCRQAMTDELNALASNGTWILVPPPTNQRIIGCKWVYKIKRRPDGSLERYKARLVAKGYSQEPGIDYVETYSPVVRATTIRLILSMAVTSNWSINQLDVSNAFLNGDLKETVYMHQPQGFGDPQHPDHVCLLKKSLYGLKQAPRAWFEKLCNTLLLMGFQSSNYDPSLFLSRNNGQLTLILVYVDDILVTGSDPTLIQQCITYLSNRFTIRDLGQVHFFLGVQVTSSDKGLFLSQTKYLSDLLVRANMLNRKPLLSPMASGTNLSQIGSKPCQDPYLFRSIVGALQYATLTRPDISFSVNKISQFMHNPTDDHWSAVKRILRYVAGTLQYGIQLFKDSNLQIHAYSDADWAGSIDDRRSTSGFCIYLGKNIISWQAKKQATVSRSSTEAEYRSLASACTEIM